MANKTYDRDQPVDGSEAKPDKLNRASFAKHLAEIIHIKPDEDCFTVSIEGGWGSGKSSVIEMVKANLKALDSPPVIIEFNPWLVGDVDSLVQKFLVQFAAQLNIPNRPQETLKAAQELLSYSKLFDVVKLIPGAEPWASTFNAVFKKVGAATSKIGKLKELDIQGRKNKVKDVVENLGVSIVVIIDDIDRLTPDEAFEVIKLSKAVADFKGTTFVLAFDQEYLSEALKAHDIHNANQFIEKIVQLRIPLPLVSINHLHELSNQYIDGLSEKKLTDKFNKDDERLWFAYYKAARYLIRTPRDLKRVMNHLKFVLAQTAGEVCFTDLYILSVIAIVCPDVYQNIKDNPWAYIGMGFDEQLRFEKAEDIVQKEMERTKQLIDSRPEINRKHIWYLLRDLFPLLSDSKFSSRSDDYDKLARVASIHRLSVALHYQVPDNMISDNETVMFITGRLDRVAHIETVIDRNAIDRFFEILSNQLDMVLLNSEELLPFLFEKIINSNKVIEREKHNRGFFSISTYKRLLWFAFEILKNSKNAYAILKSLFEKEEYLVVTSDIFYRLQVQHGEMNSNDPFLKEEKWVTESEFHSLKDLWINTALTALAGDKLFKYPDVIRVYYRLLLTSPERLKIIGEKWLAEPNGLKKVAGLVGHTGTSSSGGDYSKVNQGDLSKVFDIQRLKQLAQNELDNNSNNLEPYFLAVYRSIVTGKKYFLSDGAEEKRLGNE